MNKWVNALFVFAIALIFGCNSVPVQAQAYRAPQGADIARLKLNYHNSWVCSAGKFHRLEADSTGYADIPAGSRLTVRIFFVEGGVMSSASCRPTASIIPKSGQYYYLGFDVESGRCSVFIFKEDATKRTGLAFEPTYGSPTSDCSEK